MKRFLYVLLSFLLVSYNSSFAQINIIVDSLKNELAKCKTTGDSVYYLCRMTWNTSGAQEKFYYGNLALETAVKTDDKLKIAEAYDAAASGFRAVDSFETAKALFQKNISIGRENNFYDRVGFGSYHIAQILIKQDSLPKAVQYLKMSEEAFKKDNRKDMLMKLGWLFIKTDRKNQKANTEHLIAYIKSNINEKEDPNEKLFLYIDLANLYNNLGNRNQSIYYVQLAMDLAEKAENLKGITKSYYLIASYFRDVQQNYTAALSYYSKIMEIYESGTKPIAVASLYNDIGYNYKLAGNDSMAIQYYNKSLEISKDQHHRHTMADAYRNIGEIYYISNEYDKALQYYQKCYTTGCDQCPQIVFHSALVNIGNVYLLAHKPDSAFIYFQKAIALADSTNSTYELSISYFNLAKYYDSQNETNRSLNYNHRALNLAKEANSLSLQKDISERINQIYSNQKNYQQAYIFLAASDKLKDSINLLNNVENMARLETRFEFQNLQMQKELDSLQADKEIAKQKLLRNFFFAGIIMLSILGFMIYISYRRKKKDNRILNEQKEAIRKMSVKVHEADQAKLQFFTNISHELRTPLTIIIGVTEKLTSILNNSEFLPVIRKNAYKLLQLINHLLDLQKLDTSNMELNVSEGDLYEFIKGIAGSFETIAKQKNIIIQFIKEGNDFSGFFDHDKLEKIISNLLSNAVKYNTQNGLIEISIAKDNSRGYAEIAIADTGIGIAEKDLHNIFNRFYRVNENTSQGSGIGLALVKELVELHKGSIKVESIINKKTVFTIQLPVEKYFYKDLRIVSNENFLIDTAHYTEALDTEEQSGITERSEEKEKDINKKTLLVVEDNTDLRKFIIDMFTLEYQTIEANDGEEGVKLAQKYVPDIIISDIIMPKLSGIQMIEQIKNHETTSHIPVILLTAKNDIGTQLSSFEKGADDYISKPFDSAILKSRVENLLRLRKHLVEKFSKQFHLQPKEINIEDADQKFLEKTIGFIEKHIADTNLNIDLLAFELGVSRTQLYRKLKALTDYSANQFIRIIRLKRAAQILKHGQNNIAEVMDATGFSNYSHFNNCFKEYFGEYPKDYALLSVKGSLN